ncbi:MAG TPA: TetR/AcrR family transcriptional regulator [Pseudonocardiaceae bacterium]|nr:TetR/AcrR family transcriptional regulator [Pseudonocardiaceae bacterium]
MGPRRATGQESGREARRRRVDPRVAETQRIVKQAALDLIAEIGFEGTTVELISERSGVSRTTIYRHWPDPAVLLLEAFDPPTPDMQPPALTGDFDGDITRYIHHVADRLNDERFAAALAAQVDKAQRDPAYRAAHLQYAVARNEHGVSIFRAGVASGRLRSGIDAEHETDLILSYLVYQRLLRHRRLDAHVVDTLCSGVLARCRRPE